MNKEHKHQVKFDDSTLKALFKNFTEEEVPPGIKSRAMSRILNDWTEQAIGYSPLISKTNRWWLLGICAVLLTVTFLVDATVLSSYWQQITGSTTLANLSSLSQGFASIGDSFGKLPPILYFTALGLLALLGIDRFLNRLANN
ncbi:MULTISPECIES: hypothetical protein [unclassified Carboxylicivirga]|uniref:hypothetical protein n=1 Tax=Carboxylicivirga TaxID=1628153 RepID=UPI003D34431D